MGVQAWIVECEERLTLFFPSLFFFSETKTKGPSYSLASCGLEAGGRLRETKGTELEESYLQTVSARP